VPGPRGTGSDRTPGKSGWSVALGQLVQIRSQRNAPPPISFSTHYPHYPHRIIRFTMNDYLSNNSGECTSVRRLCIDANHFIQMTTGLGRNRKRASGKYVDRTTGINNSTSTAAMAVPSSATLFPTSYRLGHGQMVPPSYPFTRKTRHEARFSSPNHTTNCSTA